MENLKTYINDIDKSLDLNTYGVDTVAYTLTNSVSYVYIGLYKPFYNLFVNIVNQTTSGTITFEYYDGTAWGTLDVIDETRSFSRSGFISWETEIEAVEYQSQEIYWIRLTGDIAGSLDGVNMLFANDVDLKTYYRKIDEYLNDDTSFVSLHQAARNDIIQRIRNSGKFKINNDDSICDVYKNITIWDFLRPSELRTAGTYLCLSKIFENISDSTEGKFNDLSNKYFASYIEAENTFLKTLDVDDDGIVDGFETSEASFKSNGTIGR